MSVGAVWEEYAPAKVNLALHVTARREDGFHALESLVVFADLGDELTARPARRDELTVTGPFAKGLGNGTANLVSRAVAGFRERWPDTVPNGLHIELNKCLPIAAGIGGGSADAAAALRLMARISAEPVPPGDLLELARRLGADVPVCLQGQPAIMAGIGEQVTPLRQFPACHLVLVNPQKPLATADVFRALQAHRNPGLPTANMPFTHVSTLGLWLKDTRNDLQPPALALMPEIGTIVERIARTPGCMLARMSGSGATLFGLYGSAAQAGQAAQDLRASFPQYWVASAPVLGS